MCTKQEKKEMVSFLASRINLSEEKIIQAIALVEEKIGVDGSCSRYLKPDEIFEEICANAALYGIGQKLAFQTECSLSVVGMFMPVPSTSTSV